jgi:predicted metal-dependent TIM-barrel fold hydrolase
MKQELYSLGYTVRDIGKMTAREAHDIIKSHKRK